MIEARTSWKIEHHSSLASTLHQPRPQDQENTVRSVSFLTVTKPALVLGSTQPLSDVDVHALDREGIELVRRRSGGGAVLLVPGEVLWADIVIPKGDQLWCDDVGHSFNWLGRVWVYALGKLGLKGIAHEGPMVYTPWSRRVCFGGVGPGEVVVEDKKVVGISQRRGRIGARFQCAVLRMWDPGALVGLMAMSELERQDWVRGLMGAARGVNFSLEQIEAALVDSLPE